LWLLCGYFATTFLSAPPRRGAGPAGKAPGSGAAGPCEDRASRGAFP